MSAGWIRLSEIIHAPTGRAFAALTDLRRTPEWDSRIEHVEQMTRGALRPGVILRSTFKVGDACYHEDDEVAEFDPPNRFGLRSVLGTTSAVTYTLSEIDANRTRIDLALRYDLPTPPTGAGSDPDGLRQAITEALNQTLGRFREIVEREAS